MGQTTTESPPGKARQRMWFVLILIFVLPLVVVPFLLRGVVESRYSRAIFTEVDSVPVARTVVVFGAAVRGDYPTTVLRDRLDAAIQLYHLGVVDHVIMSGDGRDPSYDEPGVMARYAMTHGVPAAAITLDRAGLRTYDTCFRLGAVYGVQEAVLVTQEFHLPRALFTCNLLGVDAVGLSADKRTYRSAGWYDFRELIALTVAAWDVFTRPMPDGGLAP